MEYLLEYLLAVLAGQRNQQRVGGLWMGLDVSVEADDLLDQFRSRGLSLWLSPLLVIFQLIAAGV